MPHANQTSSTAFSEFFLKYRDTNFPFREENLKKNSFFEHFDSTKDYIPVILIKHGNPQDEKMVEFNDPNNLPEPGNKNCLQVRILKTKALQALLEGSLSENEMVHFMISGTRKKTRLLVKRGESHMALTYNNMALIYTKDKLVYVIGSDSKIYSVDKTLTELEEELDPSVFFRANRQYIVNLNFIKSFKAYQKVKILLDIDVAELEEPVIISQQAAPAFKKWMNDA